MGLGLFYSFFRLFTGQGGSGLEDFLDAIALTSLALFISSLVIILINARNLKKHVDTFTFLLIGLPITIAVAKNVIEKIHYNRTPDLLHNYPRPVSSKVFLEDSSRIAIQIDSLIALKNRNIGTTKVINAFIDTIVYSQTGRQIFICYIQKFQPNVFGNDLVPGYMSADERDSIYWHLEEGTPNKVMMSGNYHDFASLKKELRRFYFNQYSFIDNDSNKSNFFWKNSTK